MNPDIRLFRRTTLLSLHENDDTWRDVIDGLEVVDPMTGPDGRFQLIPAGAGIPLMLPSCSYWNRSVDEPWFIFTPGDDIDGGTIYIGQSDFHALAETAGYIPASQAENVNEENVRLKHDLAVAISLANDLRHAIAGLVGLAPALPEFQSELNLDDEPEPIKARNKQVAARTDDEDLIDLELGS